MAVSPTSAQKTGRIISSAASTNATLVKASPGTVRRITGHNAANTPIYLKLYDSSIAPTVGTTTVRKTIYLPAGNSFCLDANDYFGQGIALALTTGGADNDANAVGAGDILGLNVDYL